MEHLEWEIQAIRERNRRVEIDKAWEMSRTRRAVIAVLTYVTAAILLWIIAAPAPLLSACIPAAGYLLSTLSLSWIKRKWVERYDSGMAK